MYREIVDSIIDRSASLCILRVGEVDTQTRAFITPQKIDSKPFAGTDHSEAGVYDERRYLYVGKAEYDLGGNYSECTVICGDSTYYVDHAEIYELYGEPLYCRAILRRYAPNI